DLRQSTMDIFDIHKDIEVIPNFIDSSKYKLDYTDCQRSLMANEDEKILTHISNFRKVKRIPDVVQVFYKVQQTIPAKLVMVGEGPEKVKAEALCEQLGIADKVMFLGNSTEIDRILCFSDLFLLPSESESFGLAALEAMINRTAVVSSNAGGVPEVNKQGVSGFLADVGDIDEMVEKAIYMLEDQERLDKFKNQAFEVASKFDISNILPLYEEVYEKAYKARFKNSY
ncbi:MAG: N-acetyl-alpha-D-glucosaminyl L-malate synthase BshA, partial [Bacteroidota bacterium]